MVPKSNTQTVLTGNERDPNSGISQVAYLINCLTMAARQKKKKKILCDPGLRTNFRTQLNPRFERPKTRHGALLHRVDLAGSRIAALAAASRADPQVSNLQLRSGYAQ